MKNFVENLNSLADLGVVYLLLGSACNLACKHCSQTPIKNCLNLSPQGQELSQDVKDFVVRWSKLPWRFKEQRSRMLYFWGGEPLLYWETIKKLITEFESLGVKDLQYRIYSNGLLLNDEIADFCNIHNVAFTMSYDAPNALATRSAVPNQKACEAFLKIKERTINSVFNAINCNMVEALQVLMKKFPNTNITIGLMMVFDEATTPKELYTFDKGKVRRAVQELFLFSVQDNFAGKLALNLFQRKITLVHNWDRQEFNEQPYPRCHPGVVSLSVNFKGDVIFCHNDSKAIGYITDDFSKLQNKHLERIKQLFPKGCLECEHLDICRCDCLIADKKNNKLCYCDYLKELWTAIKDCCKPKTFEVEAGKQYQYVIENEDIVLKEVK